MFSSPFWCFGRLGTPKITKLDFPTMFLKQKGNRCVLGTVGWCTRQSCIRRSLSSADHFDAKLGVAYRRLASIEFLSLTTCLLLLLFCPTPKRSGPSVAAPSVQESCVGLPLPENWRSRWRPHPRTARSTSTSWTEQETAKPSCVAG